MKNTIKLNNETQKAEHYKRLYKMANCISVDYFYDRPSITKRRIENEIKSKMIKQDCIGYRILCGNSSLFTCGYTSREGKKLYIETQANTYEIEL